MRHFVASYFCYMMEDTIQYMSQQKLDQLNAEIKHLKEEIIPGLARRIDDARQMGDLSENAEYHAAREEMSWAQSRVLEVGALINNAEIVQSGGGGDKVTIGSRIRVKNNGKEKEYAIVGAAEADPLANKISNESPLGEAFMGKRKGDSVDVRVPAGVQTYKILQVE